MHPIPKLEATPMFILRCKDKQKVEYPCNEIFSSPKKYWSTDRFYNMGKFWKIW